MIAELRALLHRALGHSLVPADGVIARSTGSPGDPGLWCATCRRAMYLRPNAGRERKQKLAKWRAEAREPPP